MKFSGNTSLLKAIKTGSGGGTSPTYKAGNNIQIENGDIISTTNDLVVDSINLGGTDLATEINRIDGIVITHSQNINSLQDEVVAVNNSLASNVNTLNNEIAGVNANVATIQSYISDGYILKYRGEGSDSVNYKQYEYVSYNNLNYQALTNNINKNPETSTTDGKQVEISQTIDLSDYYDKEYIDNQINSINADFAVNSSQINATNRLAENTASELVITTNRSENNQQKISDLNARLNALTTRLTSLENDGVINNTLDALIAQVSVNDTVLRVNIKDFKGNAVSVAGQVAYRQHSGYFDNASPQSNTPYSNTYNMTSGAFILNFSEVSNYYPAYNYFCIGISVSYNNKSYKSGIYILDKPYGNYDYNGVANMLNIILLKQ